MVKYKEVLWPRCFPEVIQQKFKPTDSPGKTLIDVTATIPQHVSLFKVVSGIAF